MNRALMLLAAGVLALAACENKPTETKPDDTASKNATTTNATATATTVATPAPPPAIVDSDLSTPADFEEAAEKSISKTTYKAELAALETDIAKQ
ncbi:MAG: hypothetical protein K0S65_2850 [Labilithrix sp.]|nr:hypothetical protein [Labilithrix sp.]